MHIAQQNGRAVTPFLKQALVGLMYQVNLVCVGTVRSVLRLYLVLGAVSSCFGARTALWPTPQDGMSLADQSVNHWTQIYTWPCHSHFV